MSETSVPLAWWVERARANDPRAQAWIYQEYADRICSHAHRMLGSRQDAEDVTHETFVRAFRSLGQLRDVERLSSWLYSIASHLCLDQLRRRRLISWLPWPEAGSERRHSADPIEEMGESDLVRRTLRQLPSKDALCLALRGVEGFSCGEIADIMKCSEAAVWNRLARARAKFAATYDRLRREESD